MTDEVQVLEVVRRKGATSVACSACFVGCETDGKTLVEALAKLPCDLFLIDATADAEIERDVD